MSSNTKQEELNDKFYDYTVCNVIDKESGIEHYAIAPGDLLKIVNSEVTAVLDDLEKQAVKYGGNNVMNIGPVNIAVPLEVIQQIKQRYGGK